jgi:2-amino-4-hydroxy-6-hydroxymethyldihydropteridine diphosphokinase
MFLNQVIAGLWPGTPRQLLTAAKAAEVAAGRTPGERWGPRVADADLLLIGQLVLDEPGLQIPHPGLRQRRFVLEPLAELAPDLRDPLSGRSMADLLADILAS